MFNNFIVKGAEEKSTRDPSLALESVPMSIEDKIATWQDSQHHSDYDLRSSELWDDDKDIDDKIDYLSELQGYGDVLLPSPAFTWLLNSIIIRTRMKLCTDVSGGQMEIRHRILASLNGPTTISRNAPAPTYTMTFQLTWMWDFFSSQEYNIPPHEALERVLVLTGTDCEAWTTTCGQYVHMVWPDTGTHILNLFKELLQNGTSAEGLLRKYLENDCASLLTIILVH